MALRIDVRGMQSRLERKRSQIQASEFKPELRSFATKVLATALKATPTRSLAKITAAQRRQYELRCNYIPSVHTLEDPTLIVNESGEKWLYSGGRWFAASYRAVPDAVAGILSDLEGERDRRLSTPENQFIAERAQARFLYKRVWLEVAQSIGVPLTVSNDVQSAHSRHEPPHAPPRGYGQWRGGKNVLSVVIMTPLLDAPSRYKTFDGKSLLQPAIAAHQTEFMGDCAAKMARLMLAR